MITTPQFLQTRQRLVDLHTTRIAERDAYLQHAERKQKQADDVAKEIRALYDANTEVAEQSAQLLGLPIEAMPDPDFKLPTMESAYDSQGSDQQ